MAYFSTGSFSLQQGDTDTFDVTMLDNAGNPINITGWELYWTVKQNPSFPDSAAIIYKLQTTHSNATQGQSSFPIYPADTTGSLPGKYFFDVRAKDVSGNVTTLYNDTLFLVGSITNNTFTR